MHHLKNLRTEVKNLEYSKQSWKNMGILDVWDCLETQWGFPSGSEGKESACNVRDPGLILESGRSLEEGNGNPLQYSCLENPIDRGAWRATVHRVTKSRTGLKRLSIHTPDSLKPTQADIQQKLEANKHYPISVESHATLSVILGNSLVVQCLAIGVFSAMDLGSTAGPN